MQAFIFANEFAKFEVQTSFDDVINDKSKRHILDNISVEPQLEIDTVGDFDKV